MHTFILAFAMQCLLPVFDLSANDFFGMSVVNRDSASREFTVSATTADGANSRSGRVTIPAGGQRAFLLDEVLTPGALPAGSVSVDSGAADCPVYASTGSFQILHGTDGASVLSRNIYLPRIDINTGFVELAQVDTTVAIVNPGTVAASVTIELVNLDGSTLGTNTRTVPAKGTSIVRIADAFQQVLPNNSLGGKTFQGYARLRSDVDIAAWHRLNGLTSGAMLRGRAAEEIATTSVAIIPHFVFGGTYGSFINLINPGTTTVELELSANDERGNNIGETMPVTLRPGEARRGSVGEFFRVVIPAIFPPPTISGYIRVRERRGASFRILGDVEIFEQQAGGKNSTMLSPISDTASTNWQIPFATSANPYFTGYAIANPNELLTVQTDVTIQIVNPDGTVHSTTTASLSPRSRITAVIPQGVPAGYIRITSNLPVHVLGSIGTFEGRLLEGIPAVRLPQ